VGALLGGVRRREAQRFRDDLLPPWVEILGMSAAGRGVGIRVFLPRERGVGERAVEREPLPAVVRRDLSKFAVRLWVRGRYPRGCHSNGKPGYKIKLHAANR
jgi:hypothetical protein